VVRLRHVIMDTTNSDFGFAIRVDNAAALFVESCAIAGRDPTGAQTSAGILFEPASPLAKLFISDTTIENIVDSGVVIDTRNTGPGGSARAVLDRVRLEKNAVSVFLAGPKDPTQANIAHIRDSVVANGNGGVVAVGPDTGGVASLTIDRSSIVFSRLQGIDADGPRAFVLLGRSTVISNGTGLSAREGGSIFSYQNNHATGNVSDGAPSGTLTLK